MCIMKIGGAFTVPAVEGHMKYLTHIRTRLGERGVNVSVALLEYSEHLITPHTPRTDR